MIKHIWFDVDGTLVLHTPEFKLAHEELVYQTFSKAVNKPVTEQLKEEARDLYTKHSSWSQVFRSLGLPSDHWHKEFSKMEEGSFYKPKPEIYETLEKLKDIVPVSLFTNLKPEKLIRTLNAIGVKSEFFTFMLTGDDIKERKPALDGFHVMIEKSKLLPEEILYVGDRINVDIVPAKAVGMKTCLLWSKSDEADYCFENFEDILSLFNNK